MKSVKNNNRHALNLALACLLGLCVFYWLDILELSAPLIVPGLDVESTIMVYIYWDLIMIILLSYFDCFQRNESVLIFAIAPFSVIATIFAFKEHVLLCAASITLLLAVEAIRLHSFFKSCHCTNRKKKMKTVVYNLVRAVIIGCSVVMVVLLIRECFTVFNSNDDDYYYQFICDAFKDDIADDAFETYQI